MSLCVLWKNPLIYLTLRVVITIGTRTYKNTLKKYINKEVLINVRFKTDLKSPVILKFSCKQLRFKLVI